MLFRINYKNFLLHMIDYFTKDELINLNYAVVSAGIAVHGAEKDHVVKYNLLYPSSEVTSEFIDNGDKAILKKRYTAELEQCKATIFANIVQPIIEYYHNIVFVNTEKEDPYTDVLVEYIRKEFAMPCVDLNELFMSGETELFKIDRKELRDSNSKLSREIAKEKIAAKASTNDGKLELISMMTDKEKIKKLKELGIKRLKESDLDNLDQLLREAWLDQDDG